MTKQPHMTKRPRTCATHGCGARAAQGHRLCDRHVQQRRNQRQQQPIIEESSGGEAA